MTLLRLLLVSLLLTGCASVPPYSAPVPPAAYASDPKDRTGWSSRRMCFNQCRPALMRIRWRF